ncbi:hypothetical protein SAMN05660895_1652 [Thermoflavifilum thermophilum]|uniref:Uncharacterized protein n=1 Tax=Thermoflavifilum thermophilum TaxID=1393122 RepID=A0A1I7NFA4_9BACT|nr:hypothetical protein SAMN05660895_1652 [Thermoflavifilum thermophilum]
MSERMWTYILLACFFAIGFIIRKVNIVKSIEKNKDNNKSTLFIVLTILVVILLSIPLNIFKIGTFKNSFAERFVLGVMILGLLIRITSMLKIGKYYTRYLITFD